VGLHHGASFRRSSEERMKGPYIARMPQQGEIATGIGSVGCDETLLDCAAGRASAIKNLGAHAPYHAGALPG